MRRDNSDSVWIVVVYALALIMGVAVDASERTAVFAGVSDVTTSTGCERLTLNVDRTTSDGTTETWMQYVVVDRCKQDAVVASGAGTIPNSAFTLTSAGGSARLRTNTLASATGPSGLIDLTWTMTSLESWSVTNTWRNRVRDMLSVGKRSDEQRSADVLGTIVGLNVAGSGQFGWTSLTEVRESLK